MSEDKKVITKETLTKVRDKNRGFMKEFKEFMLKGNIVDMAVGIIIGSAFASIVTAFTDDFIYPLINGIGGPEVHGSIKIYGGQYLNWGHFVTALINFVIMAFVLFVILRFVNKIAEAAKKKEEETKAQETNKELEVLEEILKELKKK